MKMSDCPLALSVQNLDAAYGSRDVLHGVAFDVLAGQTYGLIGLNGVGKTTLMKIILGLKTAKAGNIHVFGRATNDVVARVDISYLPERFDPPWFLRGGEFIDFAASLYNRDVTQEAKEEACRHLALDPQVLKNKVQTYSKGMRQKLGLIATVLTGCPLLILDEPMSGLDPMARVLVKNLLASVRQEGRTILLSSHILSDMDEICDAVTVIDAGAVCYTGPPHGMKDIAKDNSLERSFLKIIGKFA